MKPIPADTYADIIRIRVLPILCADVILQGVAEDYPLVKMWNLLRQEDCWMVGGRALKGEPLEDPAARKVRKETDVNPFGGDSDYHAVSIVFAGFADGVNVRLDDQNAAQKTANGRIRKPSRRPIAVSSDVPEPAGLK
jgi:hypothetical protein